MSYKSQYTGSQIDEGIEKASKALTTPDTAPDSPRIVSIATDGTQQDLTLGDGLTVKDGVISAEDGLAGVWRFKDNIPVSYDVGFDAIEFNINITGISHSGLPITNISYVTEYSASETPYVEIYFSDSLIYADGNWMGSLNKEFDITSSSKDILTGSYLARDSIYVNGTPYNSVIPFVSTDMTISLLRLIADKID